MQRVVLAADDDEDARLLLSRAFSCSGIEARLELVSDGVEALDYIEGRGRFSNRTEFPTPDLLLLDIKMPYLSGFGVLEHLQKSRGPRKFPFVVFSSSEDPRDVQAARALGCDGYLVKPADFKSLVQIVKDLPKQFFSNETKRSFAQARADADPAQVKPEAESMSRNLNPSESPEIFHLLVDQIKDYAIFLLDLEGYVRSWNEGARRIKGYEAGEIIGQHFSVFYPKEGRDSEKPAFELRRAVEMGRYEEEGWRIRKDGSRFWANVVVTPLRDYEGKLTGFAKVTRDLTQRKLHDEQMQQLLETEERFRLLVDQVKDYAIFFLDARGNISSWNQGARRIKGYAADEVMGRHFSLFYTPEDIQTDKPSRALTTAIRDGRFEEESWRVRKDGRRFWASVVITALWDKRGDLTGFAKVTRDLTDRKREEDLRRARTRELEAFAHTLSHDLRAPVRSICSFSELLKDDGEALSAEERADYLEKINRSAQSMERLIRDLLKLSEVSLAPAEMKEVSLEEVLDECLVELSADIRKTGAQIRIRKPLPMFETNRTLLH